LLPLTGHSPALRPPSLDELRQVEEEVSRLLESADLGSTGGRGFWVLNVGSAYSLAAAQIVYWPLRQLSEQRVEQEPLEAYTYHHAAYHEENMSMIVFVEPGGEGVAARGLSTLSIMGSRALVIGPPLPHVLKPYGEAHTYIELALQRIDVGMLAAAAHLARILVERASTIKVRVERLGREYSSLTEAYRWVVNRYRGDLVSLAERLKDSTTLYCSPTLSGACSMLSTIATSRGYPRPSVASLSSAVTEIALGAAPKRLVLLTTGAEADIAREAATRARLTGREAFHLLIDTDPLTAPLYAALLAEALPVRGDSHS